MTATVLAVTADPVRTEHLSRALAPLGCQIVCSPAEPGVPRWESGPVPDLVVLWESPDVWELCRSTKLSWTLNGSSLLVVGTGQRRVTEREGLRVAPDRYIRETASPAAILRSVSSLLSLAREREACNIKFILRAVMASDTRLLVEVRRLLDAILAMAGMGSQDAQRVKYATLEMGLNAVEWGNRRDKSKQVHFAFKVARERFYVTVRDEGEGFDPRHISHAASPPLPVGHLDFRSQTGRRAGGYGILVCRQLMDRVTYNKRGNAVTMMKRLRGTPKDKEA